MNNKKKFSILNLPTEYMMLVVLVVICIALCIADRHSIHPLTYLH